MSIKQTGTATMLLAVFIGSSNVQAETELDPKQPYRAVKGEAVTYEFDYRIVVTPPHHAKQLRVWLPVPPSDTAQTFELLETETFPLSVEPEVNTEPKYGNTFAYFEFNNPVGAQIIRRRFRITTHELRWMIDERKVQRVERWPSTFNKYLESDASVVVSDELLAELNTFLPERTHTYRDLTLAIDWVDKNLSYSHSKASLQANSTQALHSRTGHCSDYHGLCSAFGRALGYPTRVTYGMAAFEKDSPSHCKLEAFVPGYGWVSYDVSETQKLMKRIVSDKQLGEQEKARLIEVARQRLQTGFRDNTWFLQTVGTDYELAPKASQPVKVVRTIYAEADGECLPEPDPADVTKREFSWMTAVSVVPSRPVAYPFKELDSLDSETE